MVLLELFSNPCLPSLYDQHEGWISKTQLNITNLQPVFLCKGDNNPYQSWINNGAFP